MTEKRGFLITYLILVLIIGIWGLADNWLTFLGFDNTIYSSIAVLVSFIYFFFNIFSIIIFRHQHLENIFYVLPIYHVASFLIFGIISIFLIMSGYISKGVLMSLIIIGTLTSLFEIGFSAYLLKKFNLLVLPAILRIFR